MMSKKAKKARQFTTWETALAGNKCLVPSSIHIPEMELDPTLKEFQVENAVVAKLENFTDDFDFHFKNRIL